MNDVRSALAIAVALSAALLGLAGCSLGSDASEPAEESSAPAVTLSATSTTLPPAAPTIEIEERVRVEIGQVYSDAIIVRDANGDTVEIEIAGRVPAGFEASTSSRGSITGFTWQPADPGTWNLTITATDATGLATTAELELLARHARPTDLVLVMGDSVAAGFGRDRSDFIRSDACFRSEADAYGPQAVENLVNAGSLSADVEVVLVACSGATARSLRNVRVVPTNENGDVLGVDVSQLDAATRLNPTIVMLTLGSSDVRLFDAAALTRTDAGNDPAAALDEFIVTSGLEDFSSHFALTLDTLIGSTDAHVVVTTWYDPTASTPIGVDGCRGACMVEVMDMVVGRTNTAIEHVVARQPAGRVSVARLDGDADVWEAGNGRGPDALREGFGPISDLLSGFTGGSTATCADGKGPAIENVSSLDCAHPNAAGHRAIADVVTTVLLELGG